MKFSTQLSPGRHSGYKIHHKIDPVDHAWREGATQKKYLNHAFLRSREAWLARGQNIPQLFVLALSRSMVGARPTNTSITRSCAPAKRVGARPNKYPNYSFLRPREARLARVQKIPRLLVSALPRSVLSARPKTYFNYSFWRSREAWLA